MRKKHMLLISWYLGLNLLFWIWREWTREKGRKRRQGPTSMEHAPFIWQHAGHFGFISHHLSKLWWGGHNTFHFGHEETERRLKRLRNLPEVNDRDQGLNQTCLTPESAFWPSSRIFISGSGGKITVSDGPLSNILSCWDAQLGLLFPGAPLRAA